MEGGKGTNTGFLAKVKKVNVIAKLQLAAHFLWLFSVTFRFPVFIFLNLYVDRLEIDIN